MSSCERADFLNIVVLVVVVVVVVLKAYKDHVTNEEVRAKIQQAIGPHEDLIIVKRRKLK